MNGRDDLPAAQNTDGWVLNDMTANFDLSGRGSVPFVFDSTEQPSLPMPGEVQSDLGGLSYPPGFDINQGGFLPESDYLPLQYSSLSPNSWFYNSQLAQQANTPVTSTAITVAQQSLNFAEFIPDQTREATPQQEAKEWEFKIKAEPQQQSQLPTAMPNPTPAEQREARKRLQTTSEEKNTDVNALHNSPSASRHKRGRKKIKTESSPDAESSAVSETPQDKATRNKASARAYRRRKKQFINRLETELAGTQSLNGSQAQEIEQLQSDNAELKKQVAQLKTFLPERVRQLEAENAELNVRVTRFEEQQRAQIPQRPLSTSIVHGYLGYSSTPLPPSQSGLFSDGNEHEQSNGHTLSNGSTPSNGYRRG